MFKHVLIPTDGSAVARKAIKAGVSLACELGAKITAYHALGTFQPYYGDGYIIDRTAIKAFEDRARQQGNKYLAEVEKAAKAAGVPCNSVMTRPDSPHQGIIETAKKRKCDVIFIATHGRGEFAALLLGSVTQKVLARSKIPVLVYR